MPRIRRRPKPDRRRALELLASCRDGCMEAIMLAHGFTTDSRFRARRLATATAERAGAACGTLLKAPSALLPVIESLRYGNRSAVRAMYFL